MRKMLYDPKNPRHRVKPGSEMEAVYQFILNNPGCTIHDWPSKVSGSAPSDLYHKGMIARAATGFNKAYMLWAYEPTEEEIQQARAQAMQRESSKAQLRLSTAPPTEIPTTQPKVGARQIKGHIAEIKKEVEDLLERVAKFQAIMDASYPDPKE